MTEDSTRTTEEEEPCALNPGPRNSVKSVAQSCRTDGLGATSPISLALRRDHDSIRIARRGPLPRLPAIGRSLAQCCHLGQHIVQSLTVDKLHGVVVNAVVFTDAEYGHDVCVVQPGGSTCLAAEPLQPLATGGVACGQHFQRDVPAERLLDRLIDHAHAAATDLTQDPVLAQLARDRNLHAVEMIDRRNRSEFLHDQQCGEQRLYLGGEFRMGIGIFAERRLLATPIAFDKLVSQFVQYDSTNTRVVHCCDGNFPSFPGESHLVTSRAE